MKKTLILCTSLCLIMAFIGLLATNPKTNGLDKELCQMKEVYTKLDTAWKNVSQINSGIQTKPMRKNEGFAYLQP